MCEYHDEWRIVVAGIRLILSRSIEILHIKKANVSSKPRNNFSTCHNGHILKLKKHSHIIGVNIMGMGDVVTFKLFG